MTATLSGAACTDVSATETLVAMTEIDGGARRTEMGDESVRKGGGTTQQCRSGKAHAK